MSLYKTHLRFNLIIALPILTFILYSVFRPEFKYLITFIAVFVYASYFLSPDVDITYKTKLFSFKGFLTMPFLLYSMIFRHRGISHLPIIGTLTRLAYIAGLIAITIWLLDLKTGAYWNTFMTYKSYFTAGFLAIILSDLCHLLLDLKFKF